MSDHLPDSPIVTRPYCPICEPDRDPLTELLDLRYCEPHVPGRGGADDEHVQTLAYLTGSNEAGGDDNRRWCELLSRKKTLLRGPG